MKLKFTGTHVKLENLSSSRKKNKQKFNWVRLAEKNRISTDVKYVNPRITHDGLDWWLTVEVGCPEETKIPRNEGTGIDLGLKNLAICSDGATYQNVNKTVGSVKKILL